MESKVVEEKPGGFPYGSLEITKLRLRLRLLNEALLPPFKGSTFRGLLGKSMLQAWCPHKREECHKCTKASQCPYANFFKPHLARGGRSTPSPFLIDPKPDRRTVFSKGDFLEFSLSFFGSGVRWLPFVMAAIWRGGERGLLGVKRARFQLELPRIPRKPQEPTEWAWMKTAGVEKLTAHKLAKAKGALKAIRLATPCKLKEDGKVLGKPDGRALTAALERRIAGLVHFYREREPGEEKPSWEEAPFLLTGKEELRWVVLERPSFTQGERVNIGGWVGTILVEAHNDAAGALLRVGQWTHLGKNTVLGCGKILVEEEPTC